MLNKNEANKVQQDKNSIYKSFMYLINTFIKWSAVLIGDCIDVRNSSPVWLSQTNSPFIKCSWDLESPRQT